MKLVDIEKLIIDVLSDIQSQSGREMISLTANSCPIGDLPGFDSLNGMEASMILEEKLGLDIDVDSLLVKEDNTKALNIGAIAKRIQELLEASGE